MANNQNLKPFKKGYDPRRNLKGVPAEAIAARKAIRRLGAELVHIKEEVWDPETNGYKKVEYDITRWEAMVRLMFTSNFPKDRELLLRSGIPGLLKDEVDVTSGGEKLPNENVIYDRVLAKIEKRLAGDDAGGSEDVLQQPEE